MSGQTPFNAHNSILTSTGGQFSKNALPAGANLVKATPGRVVRLSVVTLGTAGSLMVNDCSTIGAVSAANTIYEMGFAGATEGLVVTLEFPCLYGIVVTVPTGGVVSVSYL
jgi:hypothetical protein